jgi:L-lactate transport
MWQQSYTPLAGNLGLSSLVAALPVFVLLYLLGIKRTAAWIASLCGWGAAALVALLVYRMPAGLLFGAVGYGAAFGLFPIGWVVFWAIFLYRITVSTGMFEIIKDSIGSLTEDRRLQALLIAFAFGAFIEGCAGFGTPVAVAAAMLAGLGFTPFYAAGICLIANTAPVAFGSIGTPILTLAGITSLSALKLSGAVGRICAPLSLIVPSYLVVVMSGWQGWVGVMPAALLCGISFAAVQILASNFIGPQLTDIMSSLSALGTLIVLCKFWKPKDRPAALASVGAAAAGHAQLQVTQPAPGDASRPRRHSGREILLAWSPYFLLVFFVLSWGIQSVRAVLESLTLQIPWPALHNLIQRIPPVVAQPSPYAAVFTLNWVSASGTACLGACLVSLLVLKVRPRQALEIFTATCKQLFLSMVTLAAVLGLAFLMNYSGATVTLGLAFASTGVLFPFFSAMLGWLGVFLTGSDTSANALFGNLQVVTAGRLGLDPILMAASNSSGGVMGKMISLSSIAVAAAATGMSASEESRLFRFTLKHSIALASAVGLIVALYAYL